MNTIVKRHSFFMMILSIVFIYSNQFVTAQPWYDSKGREITIKAGKVVLVTEKKQSKTLPVVAEKIPSIITARPNVSVAASTEPRSSKYRVNRTRRFSPYSYNRYNSGRGCGYGYSYYSTPTFNNGTTIRFLGNSRYSTNRYRTRTNRYIPRHRYY